MGFTEGVIGQFWRKFRFGGSVVGKTFWLGFEMSCPPAVNQLLFFWRVARIRISLLFSSICSRTIACSYVYKPSTCAPCTVWSPTASIVYFWFLLADLGIFCRQQLSFIMFWYPSLMSQPIHPFDRFMPSFLLCVEHLTIPLYLYITFMTYWEYDFNIVCTKENEGSGHCCLEQAALPDLSMGYGTYGLWEVWGSTVCIFSLPPQSHKPWKSILWTVHGWDGCRL